MTDNELRELKNRDVNDEKEKYAICYSKRDDYEYLGMLWEPYGDRHFYRNVNTHEVVSIYYSIGD